jgi:hypothetical protein
MEVRMKKRFELLSLTILMVFVLSSVCSAGEYVNSRFGFKINYPSGWEKQKDPPPENFDGVSFTFSDGARISFSGINNVLESTLDKDLSDIAQNYEVKEKKQITLAGLKAYRVVAFDGKEMKLMVGCLSKNKEVFYHIYYSADPSDFDKHLKEVNSVISSFKILPTE